MPYYLLLTSQIAGQYQLVQGYWVHHFHIFMNSSYKIEICLSFFELSVIRICLDHGVGFNTKTSKCHVQFEPRHEKIEFSPMRKQSRRSVVQLLRKSETSF